MAEFEIIDDVAKAIPKGKDLKKYMPFIIAGVGAGVIALIMNKGKGSTAADNTAYDESGVASDVDLGGIMSDYANQTSEALNKQNESLSYQLSEVSANLFDVVNSQNETINQIQLQQDKAFDALKDQLEDQLAAADTYTTAAKIQETSMLSSTISSGSSIYFDGDDDDDVQYQQKASTAKTTKEKAAIAGLGNNGIGYTEENFADNAKRLATDNSYQKSEVERTKLVIENRKKAGLSTATQESYLKSIK